MAVSGMIEALSTQAPRAPTGPRGGVAPGRGERPAGEAGPVGARQDEGVALRTAIRVRWAAVGRPAFQGDGRSLRRTAA